MTPVAAARKVALMTESLRRSPGRPPVPRERIVAAALRIVDEEGADALSLRVLAQRLDSSTSTLYRHFANRADLVNEVVDGLFSDLPNEWNQERPLGWEDACRLMATWMFDTLRKHPNVAPLLVSQTPVGPNAMARRENALAMLLDAGFPPETAARCYATLARYVLGFAMQLASSVDEARLAAAYRASDGKAAPATAATAEFLPVPIEEEFRFGLELIIAGLATHRRRPQ